MIPEQVVESATDKNILAGLLAVRLLVDDPKTWTRGSAARRANGMPCGVDDPEAVRFCVIGAIGFVLTEPDRMAGSNLRNAVGREICKGARRGEGLWGLNDLRGRHAVLRATDRAIARVEARL